MHRRRTDTERSELGARGESSRKRSSTAATRKPAQSTKEPPKPMKSNPPQIEVVAIEDKPTAANDTGRRAHGPKPASRAADKDGKRRARGEGASSDGGRAINSSNSKEGRDKPKESPAKPAAPRGAKPKPAPMLESSAKPKSARLASAKRDAKGKAVDGTKKPNAATQPVQGKMSKTRQRELEAQRQKPKGAGPPQTTSGAKHAASAQTKEREPGAAQAIAPKPAARPKPQAEEREKKPVSKVCIRWLPADLPEHVFWRSVEPSLPWFSPEKTGAVVQREVLVAEPSVDGEATKAASPLGRTKPVLIDVYESENLARLDSRPRWRQFVRGKQHRSKAKPDDPSRAYILFADAQEAEHFYRGYHGHAFGRNGAVCRALVEVAAFQHVPWTLPDAQDDALENTIDQDPHFIAFLKAAVDGGGSEDAEKPPVYISYAQAASVGRESKPGATPLIDHLRKIKGRPGNSRGEAAKSKAAKPPVAPPKRPRRKNRG
ncbi:hypothetical protein GGI25_002016 [Coemansia spiralis]|uniref:UPF3 domain-containing protein n=2 Tax=Coemansia TaxID=4863 RepID=A0A9W8G9J1_9FUNG|nr:hypothetical protein EDC05_002626 [Coemansia umbellata]KAJ2623272.1 hypothetical protein GGI26_002499 [Coemansia sp. RSA 1358]KAJ2678824.1 hypothetical protein GGI25_002016 [Coemansia spiralis]